MDATQARRQFEHENNIVELSPDLDAIYRYDRAEQQAILQERPWKNE
jgi:hypothetical protein